MYTYIGRSILLLEQIKNKESIVFGHPQISRKT